MAVIIADPAYVKRQVDKQAMQLDIDAEDALKAFSERPILGGSLGKSTVSLRAVTGVVRVTGRIVHETPDAVLFANERCQGWIPIKFFQQDKARSRLRSSTESDDIVAMIPEWLAVQDGFV